MNHLVAGVCPVGNLLESVKHAMCLALVAAYRRQGQGKGAYCIPQKSEGMFLMWSEGPCEADRIPYRDPSQEQRHNTLSCSEP
jgi:hypothetical protein